MRDLAECWFAALAALVRHTRAAGRGRSQPERSAAGALTQAEIERLEREYPQIEDILPLSPLQEGLLFHALYDAQAARRLHGAAGAGAGRERSTARRCELRRRLCSIGMRACAPASGMRA